jgi:cytochrome b
MKKVFVWDLPVRLFHWILVIAICTSFGTALIEEVQDTQLHMWSGYLVLGLVLFRITWGFAGTTYAKFSHFVKGPASVLNYIQEQLPTRHNQSKTLHPAPGHNPLGGWFILLILFILISQLTTGLFANDDIMYEGPLASKLSDAGSSLMTIWHKRIYYMLGFLILLHLGAVSFYQIHKKQDLIRPMITGNQDLLREEDKEQEEESVPQDSSATNWWSAISITLMAAFIVYAIVELV